MYRHSVKYGYKLFKKKQNKTHPENKVSGTEKRALGGYRETESRDQL